MSAHHLLACADNSAATHLQDQLAEADEVDAASDEVAHHLSQLLRFDVSDVKFLLATQPLAVLARISTQEECEALEDGSSWLRADLSIDCNSTAHSFARLYSAAMALLYPIGTPLLYWYLLTRKNRTTLRDLRLNEEMVASKRKQALAHGSTTSRTEWLLRAVILRRTEQWASRGAAASLV